MATSSSPTQHHDHNKTTPLVSVTKTVPVYPKTLYPPKLLKLSNLDRQCPLLMYLVFFYKPSSKYNDLSLDSVFGRLKAGLEETLAVWYPAAGRLKMSGNNKLDLWCNNSGAVMVEAATQVKLSDLGDLSQYHELLEQLVFKPPFHGDFSEMPLVVAQVTRFGCGGYSIGTGISHSLFDGPSTHDFMRAWVANSALISNEEKRSGGPDHYGYNYKPVHDRGSLLAMNTMTPTRAAAVDHLYQLIKQAMDHHRTDAKLLGVELGGNCNLNPAPPRSNNLVLKTFHVSGATMESLKTRILGATFASSPFELLAAHLWKARTKAQGLKKERLVCLQFATDTRTKTAPPLPQGFSGNAYVLTSIALTAGELESATHQAIIHKIRQAKSSVTGDYVKSYIASLDGPPATLPPLPELTLVSDWTRMPFHSFDFLHGGHPAANVTPLATPVPQVAYLMQNPNDQKGIDIRIGLLPHTVTAFSNYFDNLL